MPNKLLKYTPFLTSSNMEHNNLSSATLVAKLKEGFRREVFQQSASAW